MGHHHHSSRKHKKTNKIKNKTKPQTQLQPQTQFHTHTQTHIKTHTKTNTNIKTNTNAKTKTTNIQAINNTDINLTLKKVSPTKTMLIGSFPCEEMAAHIRNEAVDSMTEKDDQKAISAVTYRYLQSRFHQSDTLCCVAWSTMVLVMLIPVTYYSYCSWSDSNTAFEEQHFRIKFLSSLIVMGLISVPSAVNTANTLRYKETKNGCEAWLKHKMDQQGLNKVKEQEYSSYKDFYLHQPKKAGKMFAEHIISHKPK